MQTCRIIEVIWENLSKKKQREKKLFDFFNIHAYLKKLPFGSFLKNRPKVN